MTSQWCGERSHNYPITHGQLCPVIRGVHISRPWQELVAKCFLGDMPVHVRRWWPFVLNGLPDPRCLRSCVAGMRSMRQGMADASSRVLTPPCGGWFRCGLVLGLVKILIPWLLRSASDNTKTPSRCSEGECFIISGFAQLTRLIGWSGWS